MNNIYHKAATDGYLKRLKQATKKDLNLPDDDGMTPTLYAAYHGNLDALRLCCSRGGDPDRCDYTGNTSLHFSAANGHMNCLGFLVSFGANIWQMDNDYHTPMDLAAIREKTECVEYLDGVRLKQESLDKKKVGKLQEKAKKDAEKRIEKYEKLQQRHQKALSESQTRRSIYDQGSTSSSKPGWFGTSKKSGSTTKSIESSDQNITFSQATFEKKKNSDLKKKINKQKNRTAGSTTTYPGSSDFKISENDGKTVRSLAGVPSEKNSSVLYIPNESMSTVNGDSNDESNNSGKRKTIRNDLFSAPMQNYQNAPSGNGQPSMPHFGTIALRSNFTSANSMYSALPDKEVPSLSPPSLVPDHKHKRDSSSDLDDFDEDDTDSTSLDTFLASLQLEEYSRPFKAERMDMDALTLCDHDSLKQMGLPMGDRLKILNALEERKATMQSPGDMELTMF